LAGNKAQKFKALGVESRIRIIELLKDKGPLCVNEISAVLKITPSAVSQHLKVLKYAGLVRNQRRGYWIHYEVDPVALQQCNRMLSEVCLCDCKGMDRVYETEETETEDEVTLLRKYESELEKELDEIRARIREAAEK
jgi:DNA-binding transcriptional ArsR family regulator